MQGNRPEHRSSSHRICPSYPFPTLALLPWPLPSQPPPSFSSLDCSVLFLFFLSFTFRLMRSRVKMRPLRTCAGPLNLTRTTRSCKTSLRSPETLRCLASRTQSLEERGGNRQPSRRGVQREETRTKAKQVWLWAGRLAQPAVRARVILAPATSNTRLPAGPHMATAIAVTLDHLCPHASQTHEVALMYV